MTTKACRTCPTLLTPRQIREGFARCDECRAKAPGNQRALRPKPTASQRAFAINPRKQSPEREPEQTSWWIQPECQDRERFNAIVQTRVFPYSKSLILREWIA